MTESGDGDRYDAVSFDEFGSDDLAQIRRVTEKIAVAVGPTPEVVDRVAAAVNEIAANPSSTARDRAR